MRQKTQISKLREKGASYGAYSNVGMYTRNVPRGIDRI